MLALMSVRRYQSAMLERRGGPGLARLGGLR